MAIPKQQCTRHRYLTQTVTTVLSGSFTQPWDEIGLQITTISKLWAKLLRKWFSNLSKSLLLRLFLRKISFRNPTILTPILVLPGSTCIVVTCIKLKRCEHHCLLCVFIPKADRGNCIGGEKSPTLIHSFARAIFSRARPPIVRSSTRLSCSKVFANCQVKWC